MGLDMFLFAKKFFFDRNTEEYKHLSSDIIGMRDFELNEIRFEICYWRKANQIHRWFVDNVQDGEDECKEYYVSKEQLRELLSLCKQVLENKEQAEELLPCLSGFFFGENAYDEYYYEEIERTIEIINKAINGVEDSYEFYYQASW